MTTYYAHTDPRPNTGLPGQKGAIWQELREHLLRVAHRARYLARDTKPGDIAFETGAKWAGLFHDIGKYQPKFQERLLDLAQGKRAGDAPHAKYGAMVALESRAFDLAFILMGHHAGIPADRDLTGAEVPEDLGAILARARADAELGRFIAGGLPRNDRVARSRSVDPAWELRLRMLFSILIDADRQDCQRFEQRVLGERYPLVGRSLEASRMFEALMRFIGGKAEAAPEGVVKRCRAEILQACLEAAGRPERLFSLCVPTGGGKTLASMAFALRRAVERPAEVRRVIVVIPFLSIIEQNASVLAQAFAALGPEAVLEHHSGDCGGPRRDDKEEEEDAANEAASRQRRLLTENWDAPVVVTTSVRFFDSLFSNRPSDLRRIHNIARAVVILDEVQTLPPHLLRPLLSMMRGLSEQWGTTFLFCTATQPAFEKHASAGEDDPRWEPGRITPVITKEKCEELFHALRRVADPVWPAPGEKTSWDDLAGQLLAARRALCIVNTKEHARRLYQAVRQQAEAAGLPEGSVWHLSTRMCAQHRLDRLGAIRERLRDKTEPPCIVVSTQLVEAGVDLDFPVVFRAMGPLDSIVQAAGRCDREGLLTAQAGAPAGRLVVFEPEEKGMPKSYEIPIGITRKMINERRSVDSAAKMLSIHNVCQMRLYFNTLYIRKDLDPNNIETLRGKLDFPAVASKFVMIDDCSHAVYVPYRDEGRELVENLKRDGRMNREQWHRAQRFQVGLHPNEFAEALKIGAIFEIKPNIGIYTTYDLNYDVEQHLGLVIESRGFEV